MAIKELLMNCCTYRVSIMKPTVAWLFFISALSAAFWVPLAIGVMHARSARTTATTLKVYGLSELGLAECNSTFCIVDGETVICPYTRCALTDNVLLCPCGILEHTLHQGEWTTRNTTNRRLRADE